MVKRKPSRPPPNSQTSKARSGDWKPKNPGKPQEANGNGRGEQQILLDIFKSVFAETLSSATFATTLQDVKTALFNRDFGKAFGSEPFLDVYAARWSPTRALCYASILSSIQAYLEDIYQPCPDGQAPELSPPAKHLAVLAVGAAAAETVAFGGFLRSTPAVGGSLTLVDSGPWTSIIHRLRAAVTTPPEVSVYASAAAKASNAAVVAPSRLAATHLRRDVLQLDGDELAALAGPAPLLVTLFFTLNELFTSGGVGSTTAFLLRLGDAVRPGSLLLVVDSPGSYSETSVGAQARRYPMQWLLDKVLLATGNGGGGEDDAKSGTWEKLESQDSVWFRLSQGLDYPIALEDMRYQLHLYRRLSPPETTK